ncbi:MAG: hypothetical protein ACRDGA_13930 [Bacteroidota bacterium]
MGQTMVTAGFFVLLIAAVISANRMIGESTSTTYEGDAMNMAVDIARSVMNAAYRKKFDENAIDSVYQAASDFTAPASLGPSSSEIISPWPDQVPYKSPGLYDDFDDYNGYVRTVDAAALKGFIVTVQVYYVDESKFLKSNVQTYFKRIDISVEHPTYLQNKVTYSTIVTR